MNYYEDEHGNLIEKADSSSPGTGESVAPTADTTANAKGKKPKLSDFDVAYQTTLDWGKPLACHGGELWSFTEELGWEVKTERVKALCDQIRGSNTKKGAFEILQNRLATPNLEHVQEGATYWIRHGGVWDGEWVPFPVESSQVVFSNGILNVRTKRFEKTNNRIIFGPRVTVPFNRHSFSVECGEFERMVETAIPDQVERDYLQKLCSLILQPHVILRGQIVLWGVKHSGKTTIATAIGCAPAGLVGATFMTEDRLVKNNFATVPLVNKFVNIANDSGLTPKWEDFMKSYTSGMVTVEPKFHKSMSLPATAKLISTCNEIQQLRDYSGAAEQRYKIFEFRNPVVETGEVGQTGKMKPEYWCEPSRRVGVIGWLLRGLDKALKEGILEPDSLLAKKKEAIGQSDPLYLWVRENFEVSPASFVSTKEIMDSLPVDDIGSYTVQEIGPMIKRVWGVNKARVKGERGFKGICIKS